MNKLSLYFYLNEYFEMMEHNELQSCDIIYYGNKQNNAPILCKIIKYDKGCEIMIASGVDYIFMIGLASLFFCEKKLLNEGQIPNSFKNSYDNIARINISKLFLQSYIHKSTDNLNIKQELDPDTPITISKKESGFRYVYGNFIHFILLFVL